MEPLLPTLEIKSPQESLAPKEDVVPMIEAEVFVPEEGMAPETESLAHERRVSFLRLPYF